MSSAVSSDPATKLAGPKFGRGAERAPDVCISNTHHTLAGDAGVVRDVGNVHHLALV